MATGAVIARILTQYSDKGSKAAQKDIARLTKKFDDFGRRARKSFGIAIAATATLAVKIGTDAVQAAIEDSKSQLVLAQAMRNTTGATKEAIEAAEDYINKTMFRVNVADDQLRASLATLFIATGDLTQAQKLQGIALDVSAATGKDLATVTVAITKAQQGNLSALKKLSPELSGLISTGMKAEEAFALLGSTYYGSAEALADLDPLTKLKLAYGEVLETLGYELLPVVKEFAEYIVNDVIPAVDKWIKANGEELRTALKDIVEGIIAFSGTFATLAKFVKDNEFLIKLAINLFALGRGLKYAGKFMSKMDELIGKAGKGFKNLKGVVEDLRKKFFEFVDTSKDGSFGKFIQLVGMGVEGIGKLVAGLLGLGIAGISVKDAFKAIFGIQDKTADAIDKTTKKTYNQMRVEQIAAEAEKKRQAQILAAQKAAAAAAAKAAAEAAKEAALKAAIDSKILSIRKQLNITKDSAIDKETDLIQLAAAEALLKKQGVIAKEETAKLERLKEENFLLDARETLAKRYLDIQEKLADQQLDTKEIEELSKKWGISNEAVVAYVHLVKSVEDQVISNDEIKALADMWNTSESEAQKFLETYMRIQDGLLSSDEVFALIQKGFFQSEKEARIYADLVATVHDGIANDDDFEKLRIKWDLSKSQVNAYLAAMGAKFDYQGTFIDPVTLLKTQWDLATAAVKRYLDMLNSGKGLDYNKFGPGTFVPGSGEDPAVIAAAKAAADAATAAAEDAAKEAADAAKAAADAANALAESTVLGSISSAKTTKELNDAVTLATLVGESASDIANAMMTGLLNQGMDAANAASSARYTGQAIAEMQRQQQAALDAAAARARALDAAKLVKREDYYDYRTGSDLGGDGFRGAFTGSSTMSNAQGISGGNLMAAPVVNITVQGSVTTEDDLVQTVRNGLLATQYNGNSINLQAV